MESDMVNYQKRYLAMSWNAISSFMFACKAWNCSFFSTFSPVPKRYPKRYLSDTILVHKSSQIHPVPRNQKERKSRPKRRQKKGIESPNGHEHRQLQFNLIYISDSFITISYVHAPNTVKQYSELRKTILMSHRAPQLYWVLPATHVLIFVQRPDRYGCFRK